MVIIPWQLNHFHRLTMSPSFYESFETIPEVQRMWVRPLPDLQSPDLLQQDNSAQRFLSAPEAWGTFPFRLSSSPSPVTIRPLPGSDTFIIQTVRWRDASPSAKTPHGNRLNAFDVTQTLTWSATQQKKVPERIQTVSSPSSLPQKPSSSSQKASRSPSTTSSSQKASKNSSLRITQEIQSQTTQVASNDLTAPTSISSLEWKWISSNATIPIEALFSASPYVDPMKINDLNKTSQWNILYANQTPLFLFHLEPWVWK